MINKTWTITQLISYVKNKLSNDFVLRDISVDGEIGNFTNHYSGHWYFSLKDETALIKCCMFKSANYKVGFIPKNGDKVTVKGNINIFNKSGELQLVITEMKQAGQGDFYQQFERTRKKLEPLGFFALERKKKIPAFPKQISVVTGASTAALQDIKITLSKRWPVVLKEVSAIVQGDLAIDSIIKGLLTADSQNSDVIILARGGGSIDDLWCFNDERIATTIFNLKTPIITGIGHEIDTTIADLVADLRAATPTAAAVAATPVYSEVESQIKTNTGILISAFQNKINNASQHLDYHHNKLEGFANRLEVTKTNIINNDSIIRLSLMKKLDNTKSYIDNVNQRMESILNSRIPTYNNMLTNANEKLMLSKDIVIKTAQQKFNHSVELLDSLSPLKTISRGFIVSKQDGKVIKSVNDIEEDKNIELTYKDGKVNVRKVN